MRIVALIFLFPLASKKGLIALVFFNNKKNHPAVVIVVAVAASQTALYHKLLLLLFLYIIRGEGGEGSGHHTFHKVFELHHWFKS